jgi:adhesin/invasin
VASGSGATVTLQARDANGNNLTTGGLAVAFALGSASGGQGVIISSVTDNNNGTYTATFAATSVGANTITAKVGGIALTSTAPAIIVTPGLLSLAKSPVTLSAAGVASGSGVTVTLTAEDAVGNKITTGGLAVTFALGSPSGGQGTFGAVTDNHNGTYTATFTGTIAGANIVTATIGGQAVTSIAPITVTRGPASLAKSLISLAFSSIASGGTDTVTLQAVDAAGNKFTKGGLTVVFALVSSAGGQGTFSTVTDNQNGTYTAKFTGTTAGANAIKATIGGAAVTSTAPAIAITAGASLSKSLILLSSSSLALGTSVTVTLQSQDANGNNLTSGGLTVAFSLGSLSGAHGVFIAVTDNHDGTYTATFVGTAVGINTIKATIGGVALTSVAPSITVV